MEAVEINLIFGFNNTRSSSADREKTPIWTLRFQFLISLIANYLAVWWRLNFNKAELFEGSFFLFYPPPSSTVFLWLKENKERKHFNGSAESWERKLELEKNLELWN